MRIINRNYANKMGTLGLHSSQGLFLKSVITPSSRDVALLRLKSNFAKQNELNKPNLKPDEAGLHNVTTVGYCF
ncbi:MAG: hypothetical protein R3Y50_04490 [Rikenellaceae bacterium]